MSLERLLAFGLVELEPLAFGLLSQPAQLEQKVEVLVHWGELELVVR